MVYAAGVNISAHDFTSVVDGPGVSKNRSRRINRGHMLLSVDGEAVGDARAVAIPAHRLVLVVNSIQQCAGRTGNVDDVKFPMDQRETVITEAVDKEPDDGIVVVDIVAVGLGRIGTIDRAVLSLGR